MKSLSSVKSNYYKLARQLGAPRKHIRFATVPQHDGGPHVEIKRNHFCYVITEQGTEYLRKTAKDDTELMYWLLSDLTRAMANDYELAHRKENNDCRRLLFRKHVALLAQVSATWAKQKQSEYDQVLREHPFSDSAG